jgi:gluconate/galactonate dehydratase
MKITDMRTAIVKVDDFFKWIFIKVYTDEDITGVGEASGVMSFAREVKTAVEEFKPMLIGEDPLNTERLFQKMLRQFPSLPDWSGAGMFRSGPSADAAAGIEIALWDIKGKYLNCPVYSLLGGKFRDKIRLYSDLHAEKAEMEGSYSKTQINVHGYINRAKEAIEKGFNAIKFDIDEHVPQSMMPSTYERDHWNGSLNNTEIEKKAGIIAAVREAIGYDIDLAIDCHWYYNTNSAIRLAKELEGLKLMWIEDPVPYSNMEAMKKITESVETPVLTGECLRNRHEFKDLIVNQAADIISPDIPCNSLQEVKKIADFADIYFTPVAPHNVGSPVATMAATHVCATIPNFMILEYHHLSLPWWEKLIKTDRPLIENGYVKVLDKPGLGIELNEEELVKHLDEGETIP